MVRRDQKKIKIKRQIPAVRDKKNSWYLELMKNFSQEFTVLNFWFFCFKTKEHK